MSLSPEERQQRRKTFQERRRERQAKKKAERMLSVDEGLPTPYVVRRLAPYALPHWPAIFLALVLIGASTGLDLLGPWPMAFIIDHVLTDVVRETHTLSGRPMWILVGVCAALVIMAVANGLISFLQAYFVSRASRQIVFDLRAALFNHVQRLSLQFHSNRRTGDLIQRVTSDVRSLKDLFTDTSVTMIHSALYLVGMTVLLLWMDWQLGLLSMVATPPLVVLGLLNTRTIRRYSRAERGSEGQLSSIVSESLGAMRLIRVFNQEDEARNRFSQQNIATSESAFQANLATARFGWLIGITRAGLTAFILVFAVHRVVGGSMSIGHMTVFLAYVRNFYRPLRTSLRQFAGLSATMARAERVVDLLDTKEGVVDAPNAVPAEHFRGEVDFRNVSFSYESSPVLQNVSLRIPAGKTTAVVGPTGVGKTTLISLIPRLYDPDQGEVLIDGQDIRAVTLKSLREQVSVVLQESVLFRASIFENIAYGRAHATLDDIVGAAKAANAHEFIMQLPNGYETEVGERGETLSGGQRQRIAIARAMIRDAPILILDEPLVGLDAASADVVLEALERLTSGRTAIVISHLVSSVLNADHVIVLESGRVAREGTVEEVVALGANEDGFIRTHSAISVTANPFTGES
jgi:ABC-type multidrug transport system fused ATPase/permease subunit